MQRALIGLVFLVAMPAWGQATWSGSSAAEYRNFARDTPDPVQANDHASIMMQPQLRIDWDQRRQSLTATPFYRWDQRDTQRSHGDMRELFWLYVGNGFEARLGLSKVFWGVTESQHLVDVINQTDHVENPEGTEKLGQPMASIKAFTSAGTWEMFVLPYFRERTFPGRPGRLRSSPHVDTREDALYENSSKQRHVDYALRWGQTVGAWDIGISHFLGTNRDPRLVPEVNRDGESVLLPYYEQMRQTGLDVQATLDSWLLKLEAIHRGSNTDTYNAAVVGVEYTVNGVFDSASNVGLVAEYLYDSRGSAAPTPYQDDIMLGLRLTPNDIQSTDFLIGVVADRHATTRVFSLKASRRLTNHLRLGTEGRIFSGVSSTDPLDSLRQDNYIQLELRYYF